MQELIGSVQRIVFGIFGDNTWKMVAVIIAIVFISIVVVLCGNIEIEIANGKKRISIKKKQENDKGKPGYIISIFVVVSLITVILLLCLCIIDPDCPGSGATPTPTPTYTPSPTPTPTYTPSPTPTPTYTPSPTPTQESMEYYGTTNADSIYIRRNPRRLDNNVEHCIEYAGSIVRIYGFVEVEEVKWYKVAFNGHDGYVVAQYIDLNQDEAPPALRH